MKGSKFITLLRTLSAEELPAFHKYLRQMHGGEKVALQVFEYVRKLYPKFEDNKKLEIDYIYQKLFGGEKQENPRKKMLDTLSDLHLWLKKFLLIEKLDNDLMTSQLLWASILEERHLQEEYSKHITRFHKDVKDLPRKDAKIYLVEMTVGYFYYQYLAQPSAKPRIEELENTLTELEICAETIRLRLACQLANIRKVQVPESVPIATVSSLTLPRVELRENSPLLELYYNIYQLIDTEKEVYYDNIAKAFFKADEFEEDELHGALSYLHNYVATQLRNGTESNITARIHELNKYAFTHGLFNSLSAGQFANIVSMACSVKDYKWATHFVEKCPVALPAEAVLLARAAITFGEKQFEEVLNMLEEVDFKGLYEIIRSRLLILRSYVELDSAKAFDYCSSFELWINGRKPKTEAVEGILATVRIIKMLIMKKQQQQKILAELEKAPLLYTKSWLREKVANYKAIYAAHKQSK